MALTLADLHAMGISEVQVFPMVERDQLIDLIITDGCGHITDLESCRTRLYSDYF